MQSYLIEDARSQLPKIIHSVEKGVVTQHLHGDNCATAALVIHEINYGIQRTLKTLVIFR